MPIRITKALQTQLDALADARRTGVLDWIELVKLIQEDPRTFFENDDWSYCDFSKSDMSQTSFRGAILDGAVFREADYEKVIRSYPYSAVDVRWVSSHQKPGAGELATAVTGPEFGLAAGSAAGDSTPTRTNSAEETSKWYRFTAHPAEATAQINLDAVQQLGQIEMSEEAQNRLVASSLLGAEAAQTNRAPRLTWFARILQDVRDRAAGLGAIYPVTGFALALVVLLIGYSLGRMVPDDREPAREPLQIASDNDDNGAVDGDLPRITINRVPKRENMPASGEGGSPVRLTGEQGASVVEAAYHSPTMIADGGDSEDNVETLELPSAIALAASGDGDAQAALGRYYLRDAEGPESNAEAFRLLTSASKQGVAAATLDLSIMYNRGIGIPVDDAESSRLRRLSVEQGADYIENKALADEGNPIAQYNVGFLYREVEFDAEAASWFSLAAEQGDALAQEALGYLYRFGRGVPQDDAEAMKWLRRSALQQEDYKDNIDAAMRGDATAQLAIGGVFGSVYDNSGEALWYRLAAEQGLAAAQVRLGLMYQDGSGVPKDEAEARRWLGLAVLQNPDYPALRAAAEEGQTWGQFLLGELYENAGALDDAYDWYLLAAEQGDQEAQEKVGTMLVIGRGPPESEIAAQKWFRLSVEHGNDYTRLRLAAERGDPKAQRKLGDLYFAGKAEVEGLEWYRTAAELGDIEAQFQLGRHSLIPVEAAKWLEIGMARGDDRAARYFGNVADELTQEEAATAKASAAEWLAAHSISPEVQKPNINITTNPLGLQPLTPEEAAEVDVTTNEDMLVPIDPTGPP